MKIFPTKIENRITEEDPKSTGVETNMTINEGNNSTYVTNGGIKIDQIRNFDMIHNQLRGMSSNDDVCANEEIIQSARSVSDVSDIDQSPDIHRMNNAEEILDSTVSMGNNHVSHQQSKASLKGKEMITDSNCNENEYSSSPSKPQGSKRIRYLKEWVAVINKFAADEVRTCFHAFHID